MKHKAIDPYSCGVTKDPLAAGLFKRISLLHQYTNPFLGEANQSIFLTFLEPLYAYSP